MKTPTLLSLHSVGTATVKDLNLLNIHTVDDLKSQDPQEMYERLCSLTQQKHDICVLDVFCAAVEQAKNPQLPRKQANWWYWSRIRKIKQHT
jgi:nucleotidyltransferase/DNA polymerase involved in DNA repair